MPLSKEFYNPATRNAAIRKVASSNISAQQAAKFNQHKIEATNLYQQSNTQKQPSTKTTIPTAKTRPLMPKLYEKAQAEGATAGRPIKKFKGKYAGPDKYKGKIPKHLKSKYKGTYFGREKYKGTADPGAIISDIATKSKKKFPIKKAVTPMQPGKMYAQ
jgi:hypothetical protein